MARARPGQVRGSAAAHELLDEVALDGRVEALLGDPLHWFPVRHHSPAAARFVREALRARRPKLVLIEGPPQADALVQHIVDPKTKPPVAIYSMYRDDDDVLGLAGIASPAADIPARFSAWYPLMAYSPEYVAMKTAQAIGAEVRFIDLPHHALIEQRRAELAEGREADEEGEDEDEHEHERGARALGWEHYVLESRFYERLAAAAGYRTWDEAWDALFECGERHADAEAFRRDMALFCGGVRATTPRARMERDGTFARERHMWRTIQRVLAERGLGPEQAFVVTGGFHLFLDRQDAEPPPEPPEGTVYTTVAPYSYARVSELTGYGAGNRAPRYYGLLWEALGRDGREDGAAVTAMVQHVVAVLGRGRKEAGEGLSSADAIAVTQHARMLAGLRGRRAPLLDDVRDALVTCCVKGDPREEGAQLLRAMAIVETGNAVGRVTPALGRLPLVYDFYAQLDALELGELLGKDRRLSLTLDRREERDARRSCFLHRLVHLGVPVGKCDDLSGATGRMFRERWALKWSPKLEEALIERSLHGDDVESAAVAVLEEELRQDEQHAGRTCERLVRSVVMDLPGLVQRLEASCGAAIDADHRLEALAEALTHLLVLDRQAAFKGASRAAVQELIARCYGRACFAIPGAASVPEEEQPAVLEALKALGEAALGEHEADLDRALLGQNLRAAASDSTVPFLQGAFEGLLVELREQTPEELAARVAAFARARPETMVQAGEFLDGVLSASRTSIMLGAGSLVLALDELLRSADWDAFATMLPRMRHAFEQLHQRQRTSICDRVAEQYGLKDAEEVARLETSVAAAAHLASIDARVAALMEEWTF